ncbi:hypothetical protein U1872_03645 [Sphingomonas sp. RB3P16]|uniref:hypothetical protein n=1 Tax=Parasphingomonas frigoris TaxID=3096163 RepID=UPI002FCC3B33
MSIEAIAAGAGAAPLPPMTETIQAGPNVSVADATSFQGSLTSAAGVSPVSGPDATSPMLQKMFSQLEKVNGEAKSVSDYANKATAAGSTMTPGEVVKLTMQCHEFMFHCQLTSNIANRTSDGVQQLFRQQS